MSPLTAFEPRGKQALDVDHRPQGTYRFSDVDEQQLHLAQIIDRDFRAQNLFRLVKRHLLTGSILDVGCGTGALVASLLQEELDATGIDISDQSVATAKRYLLGRGLDPERVQRRDLDELVRANQQFDNVVSLDCLEHIDDDQKFFDQMVHLLKPRARLILSVPALGSLYGEKDRKIGHFRRYERSMLLDLASRHPLTVHRLRFWNGLGVVPTYVTQRLLHRAVDESFRYGPSTRSGTLKRWLLFQWFRWVENTVAPPLGLTLLLIATRDDGPASS
jgi:2-polyprenyl-3-methyl-5-hydroxy-6-metoxy-1,4-benzoquinol methylase